MHPQVESAPEHIKQREAAKDDQDDEDELTELLTNVVIVELEPDSANADHSPDASTGACAETVWLENG